MSEREALSPRQRSGIGRRQKVNGSHVLTVGAQIRVPCIGEIPVLIRQSEPLSPRERY